MEDWEWLRSMLFHSLLLNRARAGAETASTQYLMTCTYTTLSEDDRIVDNC